MLRHLQRGLPLARRTLITSPPSSLACRGQLLERPPQWGHPRGFQSSSILGTTSRPPQPPALSKLPDPDKKAQAHDLAEVRKWVEEFKRAGFEVLRDAKGVVVTFSRSSGPGGQNVNKVNTKATLRCAIDSEWMPVWAREELVKEPHYASSSHSILVTSTTTRSQAQNIDDCLLRLHDIILTCSTRGLKSATSEETKKRVGEHIKAEKAHRRLEKEKRSGVKNERATAKGRGPYWDH